MRVCYVAEVSGGQKRGAEVSGEGGTRAFALPFDVPIDDLSTMVASAGFDNALTRAAQEHILASDDWGCSLCECEATTMAHSPIFQCREGTWVMLDAVCLPLCGSKGCSLAAAHRTQAVRRQIYKEVADYGCTPRLDKWRADDTSSVVQGQASRSVAQLLVM
mmetsp:Transcript_2700/g.8350  ORF Transcript_2700/g.8350 Transcript_2700/m.8350 type:complete len:162 (+) Transcript_2700:54-539(+)